MKKLIYLILLCPVLLFAQWQIPWILIPSVDNAGNVHSHEVIGNKNDTSSGTSIVSLQKAVKAETDKIDGASKVWLRIKCPGQNTATLDFFIGVHGYEG